MSRNALILPAALALSRKVMGKRMPTDVVVVAVEAADLTTFSEHLTSEVEAAIPEVLPRVERLIQQQNQHIRRGPAAAGYLQIFQGG